MCGVQYAVWQKCGHQYIVCKESLDDSGIIYYCHQPDQCKGKKQEYVLVGKENTYCPRCQDHTIEIGWDGVDKFMLFAKIESKLESLERKLVVYDAEEESEQANNKPNRKMPDTDQSTEKDQIIAGPDMHLVITDSSEEGHRANRFSSGKMSDDGGLLRVEQHVTGPRVHKTRLGIGIGTHANRRFLVPMKSRLRSVWKRIRKGRDRISYALTSYF